MKKVYLFWYWSLINKESAKVTNPNLGNFIPVRIKWFRREWNINIPKFKMTAVGLVKDKNSSVNWVLIEIPENVLIDFDRREVNYYRIEISKDNIKYVYDDYKWDLKNYPIYCYLNKRVEQPNEENPIVMSYVDVILTWCIDIWWLQFAKEFILSTGKWIKDFILNDRQSPRYPRYLKQLKYEKEIDELMKIVIW